MLKDYSEMIPVFCEIIEGGILKKLKNEYHRPVEITDGLDVWDAVKGEYHHIDGLVASCDDWIDGDPESEYIKIPQPCSAGEYRRICREIIERSLWLELDEVKELQAKWHIERYIKDFAKKLSDEWEIFKKVSLRKIPIYITSVHPIGSGGETDYETAGFASDRIISINNLSADHIDRAETTARHELLHYMLYAAGLPSVDDSAVFWFFAELYDADPYKQLPENEREILDTIKSLYEPGGRAIVDKFFMTIISAAKEGKQELDITELKNILIKEAEAQKQAS